MTLLLALDTATDRPSLALGTPDAPGEAVFLPSRHDLSREIERIAAGLLEARRVSAADLDGVLVADGPGSFTGLRIGVAFAKGLCRSSGLAFLAAPSLLGAAFGASGGAGIVVAEYDALRGEVFRAAYRFGPGGDGAIEVLLPPSLVSAGSAVAMEGKEQFRRATAAHASAASLLALASRPGALTEVGDAAAWEPAYGRLAEAEARLRARRAVPKARA